MLLISKYRTKIRKFKREKVIICKLKNRNKTEKKQPKKLSMGIKNK